MMKKTMDRMITKGFLWLGLCMLACVMLSLKHANKETAAQKGNTKQFVAENVAFATKQIDRQLKAIEATDTVKYPRTTDKGQVVYVPIADWTSGFFPGCLWQMYALTKEDKWAREAERFTAGLEPVKKLKWHHDVGFMIGCSFGNGYAMKKVDGYKEIIIEVHSHSAVAIDPRPS